MKVRWAVPALCLCLSVIILGCATAGKKAPDAKLPPPPPCACEAAPMKAGINLPSPAPTPPPPPAPAPKLMRMKPVADSLSAVAVSSSAWSAPTPAPAPGVTTPVPPLPPPNAEAYVQPKENPFLTAQQNPLSTFSIDVDTASYANVRRFLNGGNLPPREAVRIEELVNYFPYAYPQPTGPDPFSVTVEEAACPWNAEHQLARIGLKGKEINNEDRPPSNLVFLLDVSGSMSDDQKLPLVKQGLRLLVPELRPKDRVAIVTYAGTSGVALESTSCSRDNKQRILTLIEGLASGGSTQGSAGLRDAYRLARENLITKGTNRVILATDGDFNVGVTDRDELVKLIEGEAKSGVFLTVLGFGMGNLKDATLEQLADKGNGQYAYVDNLNEARRLFLEQMSGSLVTIAKDVKIQVEFNPRVVAGYRLVGYENRMLKTEEFNDDTKDAGEIGAGHTVTALYEIVPAGKKVPTGGVDPLRYQNTQPTEAATGNELMTVKVRYKEPRADDSKLLTFPIANAPLDTDKASMDFRFATAVAAFGQLLRDSEYKGDITYDRVIELGLNSRGEDEYGYRIEFVNMVRMAKALAGK